MFTLNFMALSAGTAKPTGWQVPFFLLIGLLAHIGWYSPEYHRKFLFYSLQVFHTCLNLGFFTEIWVAASLFRTFLRILANLSSARVWMVLIVQLISSSPSLFSRFLRTVLWAPTTISIPINIMSLIVNLFAFLHFDFVISWNCKIHSMTSSFLVNKN